MLLSSYNDLINDSNRGQYEQLFQKNNIGAALALAFYYRKQNDINSAAQYILYALAEHPKRYEVSLGSHLNDDEQLSEFFSTFNNGIITPNILKALADAGIAKYQTLLQNVRERRIQAEEKYLKDYQGKVETFGRELKLKGDDAPALLVNPGIGGDLHNILLMTDAPIILVTDVVPFNINKLQQQNIVHEGYLHPTLKGTADVAFYCEMHEYFLVRANMLSYTISSAERNEEGLVHVILEKSGKQREIYYMQANKENPSENNIRIIAAIKSLLPTPNKSFVYLEKAFDVNPSQEYRDFFRQLKSDFNGSRIIIDGKPQSLDKYEYTDGVAKFELTPEYASIAAKQGVMGKKFCYDNQMREVKRTLTEKELSDNYLFHNQAEIIKTEQRLNQINF